MKPPNLAFSAIIGFILLSSIGKAIDLSGVFDIFSLVKRHLYQDCNVHFSQDTCMSSLIKKAKLMVCLVENGELDAARERYHKVVKRKLLYECKKTMDNWAGCCEQQHNCERYEEKRKRFRSKIGKIDEKMEKLTGKKFLNYFESL